MAHKTIKSYLASLSPERLELVEAIRAVIAKNVDPRFEEGMQYGMPAWYLPHSEYEHGYHCDPKQPLPYASLASQKNHVGIYLFCIYGTPAEQERFATEWKKTGCRLDMGKSCIRVKKLEEVPLAVIGRTIKRVTAKKFIKAYETVLPDSVKKKRAAKTKS
ncbi:MAG: DUF1801 domain-containing protein [Planctomycetota bacterium]|nr:DUF1801 domain-containing protein [Planctomycetota bacterium]